MPSRSLAHYSTSFDDLDLARLPALMARANARWSKKVTAFPPTRKVTRRFRRSDVNDRDTLQKIQQFVASKPSVASAPLVAILTPTFPSPFTLTSSPRKASNDNALPVWENGARRLKLVMANEALGRAGKPAVSWTLNLSPDCIERAQRHPKGLVDCLKRDLDRALRRQLAFIPHYWFSADATPTGRLHLHGGIGADGHELDQVRAALLHVGGEWDATHGSHHQLDMNLQRCDEGWATYAIRRSGAVRKIIKGCTYTIAGPLRTMAKSQYDSYRALIGAA